MCADQQRERYKELTHDKRPYREGAGAVVGAVRSGVVTVGFDFVQMGVQTGYMVDKVLKGTKPGDLSVIYMKDIPNGISMYLNKASAEKMGVTIPKSVLDRAATVF